MSVFITLINVDIESICSLFFPTEYFLSLQWLASLFSTTLGLSMAAGVLWSTMGIRDSSWNLVSTHLSGKTQTSSYTAHGGRYNVIQIRIRGSIQFKRSKANIIQRFIVKRKHFIGGFDQLMNS